MMVLKTIIITNNKNMIGDIEGCIFVYENKNVDEKNNFIYIYD